MRGVVVFKIDSVVAVVVTAVSGPNVIWVVVCVPGITVNEIFPMLPVPFTSLLDNPIARANTIFPGVVISVKRFVYVPGAPSKELDVSGFSTSTFVITAGSYVISTWAPVIGLLPVLTITSTLPEVLAGSILSVSGEKETAAVFSTAMVG